MNKDKLSMVALKELEDREGRRMKKARRSEEQEREWYLQVEDFLYQTEDEGLEKLQQQRQQCFSLDCCDCSDSDECYNC